jgi:AcrR family transcriptional regulator
LRERKKQRTRQLVADTALELFLERGFDAATVADVARSADVDVKTIYNYFPSKPDLVYHGLDEFGDSLVAAVRDRNAGESVLDAFARFLLGQQGFVDDAQATARLRAVSEMILGSPPLLAHEEQIYGRLTTALAEVLTAQTRARGGDIQATVVAHSLIGLHRALVSYVRAQTLAGTPNPTVARGVRAQIKKGVGLLANGLDDYGIKSG